MTSRGCSYKCTFCSTTKNFQTFRARSPENVLDEIELLVKKYGVKEVHFQDDNFICYHDRAIAIAEGMMKRGLRINWDVTSAALFGFD